MKIKERLRNWWYFISSFFIWRCEKCHGMIKFHIQKEDGSQVYICTKCGAKYEIPYQFQDGYDNNHLEQKL